MFDSLPLSGKPPGRYSDKRAYELATKVLETKVGPPPTNWLTEDVVRFSARHEARTWRLPRVSQVRANPDYYAVIAGIDVEKLEDYIARNQERNPRRPLQQFEST